MAKYRLDSIEMPDGNEFEIPIFIAEFDVTPFSEIGQAVSDGKAVLCADGNTLYNLTYFDESDVAVFSRPSRDKLIEVFVNSYGWQQDETTYLAYSGGNVDSVNGHRIAIALNTSGQLRASPITFGSSTTQYLANNGTWQNIPTVPTKVSDLTNDSGFITTETDPTVPAWAKQNTKPSYTASEVGAIAAPSSPATGSFLVWDGLAWVAQSLSTWQGGSF